METITSPGTALTESSAPCCPDTCRDKDPQPRQRFPIELKPLIAAPGHWSDGAQRPGAEIQGTIPWTSFYHWEALGLCRCGTWQVVPRDQRQRLAGLSRCGHQAFVPALRMDQSPAGVRNPVLVNQAACRAEPSEYRRRGPLLDKSGNLTHTSGILKMKRSNLGGPALRCTSVVRHVHSRRPHA